MQKIITLIVIYVCIVSCDNPKVNNEASKTFDSINGSTKSVMNEYSGIYLIAENKIKTCDAAIYSIVDESGKLELLSKELIVEGKNKANLVVHAKGKIDANNLIISEVITIEPKNFRNTCLPYDFWCLGNEPFWQVQISKNENLIDFYNPMEQELIHFDYVQSIEKNNSFVYTANTNKNEIKVTIHTQKCSDGMSERMYNYAVSVMLNGNEYKGCAIKFGDKIE
ncbi:MAG: hypothetical protein JNL69_03980 [Bacteroidia bacterium]|nr:hypothetical protein [Bacteroidia bacterium]